MPPAGSTRSARCSPIAAPPKPAQLKRARARWRASAGPAPPLEIPIGQLPLPNLREGQALSGDYGVMQAVRVVIVNTSRYGQAIALYANPRGGAATGTFIIDDTLVQAHRLSAYSRYKIWQETIAPGTYRTLRVQTMPEGGSSYPLRLIFAQDDGSVAPGAPGSPVY